MSRLTDWCSRCRPSSQVLLLLSISGFLYQVYHVSDHYFEYATVTRVLHKPRQLIRPGNLNFCPRFIDILDRERVFKETGIRLRHIHNDSDAYDMEGLLTVAQVYRYTPAAETAVTSCSLRGRNNRLTFYDGKECRDRLNVTKYFTQEYMCYLVMLRDRTRIPLFDVTTSSVGQYVVDVVSFSDAFAGAEFALAVMSKGTAPTTSRHYSRTLRIKNMLTGVRLTNEVALRHRHQTSVHLEKPYDTACINISYKWPIYCNQDCLISQYAGIDRVPAQELLVQALPLKPLSQRDLVNQTMADFVRTAKADCAQKCYVRPCRVSFGYTSVFPSLGQGSSESSMHLSELSPGEPDLSTVSQPTMRLVEYFSFVCSCFGIWFGLSFLSLNPATFRRSLSLQFGTRNHGSALLPRPSPASKRPSCSWQQERDSVSGLDPRIMHMMRTERLSRGSSHPPPVPAYDAYHRQRGRAVRFLGRRS